jgi:transposase-like protein
MAYSKEERERIIQYHLTSGNSLSRTSREFGIGGSMTLAKWLKHFEESKKISTFAAEINSVDAMHEKSNADLQRQIKELEAALHAEKLKNLALNTMIDIAESQGIQIRKKSGAKQ